jgi:hypothetical protein
MDVMIPEAVRFAPPSFLIRNASLLCLEGFPFQSDTVTRSRRGFYAGVGFLAGAATGAGIGWYRCQREAECVIPIGAVLLAALGGAIGALVGLLLSP